ncbi:MAG: hypothetical protein M1828_005839 [Chrysothrix sp. TS-e1954]|nr:MAG: hypothetical protein M1828_005839 [Chrysothrix sp. TS-e1954]
MESQDETKIYVPPKVDVSERTWDYEYGYSTGIVTIAEVRRAPYHSWLRRLGGEEQELVTADLRELHSKDWNSRVSVYDFPKVYNEEEQDKQNPFSALHIASCHFSAEDQEYRTFKLEELRSRSLESSMPPPPFRLIVVEDITPPVLEILGTSLALDTRVVMQHIQHAWDSRSNQTARGISSYLSSRDSTAKTPTFIIAYPRILEVRHRSALRVPDWRSECLRRAAKFLQCRYILPVFDVPEQDLVQCVALEHITCQFKEIAPNVKRAIVLFPPSVKEWHSGGTSVRKHQPSRLEDAGWEGDQQSGDVNEWLDGLRTHIEGTGGLFDSFALLSTLWSNSLEYWEVHLVHVSRAVELLAMSHGAEADERALKAQQQVRAVVTQGIAVLSHTTEKIKIVITALNEGTAYYETSASDFFDTAAKLEQRKRTLKQLQWLEAHFDLLKVQMERHVPTLEHHINIVIVAQQVHLAETQLEESRKAIQQADTIKRLTILAFVYLPIQTAGTLFGMNVSELRHQPSVWTFALVTVALLIVTMTAAAWHKIYPAFCRGYDNGIGSFRVQAANAAGKVGVNIPVSLPKRYQAEPPITDPSWVL